MSKLTFLIGLVLLGPDIPGVAMELSDDEIWSHLKDPNLSCHWDDIFGGIDPHIVAPSTILDSVTTIPSCYVASQAVATTGTHVSTPECINSVFRDYTTPSKRPRLTDLPTNTNTQFNHETRLKPSVPIINTPAQRGIISHSSNKDLLTLGHELHSFPPNPNFPTTAINTHLVNLKPASEYKRIKSTKIYPSFQGGMKDDLKSNGMIQPTESTLVRNLSLSSSRGQSSHFQEP
jgi:hypothetical protein